jgi:hypothetical protein
MRGEVLNEFIYDDVGIHERIDLDRKTRRNRMDVIIILIALIAFALAALRWGVNSTDGINSPEWERRQNWYGFHERGRA